MNINFAMWKTALWTLVKMDKKEDWDKLDVVSKWLIATRSGVTLVTVYTCVIAGLLAWRDGYFDFLPWLVLTLGLFIAHGTNNLLNDYTDFSRGVDKDNYFRTQYGVHPLVQGFWDKPTQLRWFMVSGVIAFLSGVYALFYSHFDPLVIGLFALGALVLLFYTYPLKYLGPGRIGYLPHLGTDHGGGRVRRPGTGSDRQHLECRPGRCAIWLERCQHQCW